jgi:hypothetical protein
MGDDGVEKRAKKSEDEGRERWRTGGGRHEKEARKKRSNRREAEAETLTSTKDTYRRGLDAREGGRFGVGKRSVWSATLGRSAVGGAVAGRFSVPMTVGRRFLGGKLTTEKLPAVNDPYHSSSGQDPGKTGFSHVTSRPEEPMLPIAGAVVSPLRDPRRAAAVID